MIIKKRLPGICLDATEMLAPENMNFVYESTYCVS